MRGLLMAVAVLLAGAAHAGDFAQPVIEGVTSTMTVSAISIATQTATSVLGSLAPLYRQVCVQNLDSSAFVTCGESVSVSTQIASGLFGVYLATETATTLLYPPFCFPVVPGHDFYCHSGSVSAASRVVIIRKR